jgi:hypothetical protein
MARRRCLPTLGGVRYGAAQRPPARCACGPAPFSCPFPSLLAPLPPELSRLRGRGALLYGSGSGGGRSNVSRAWGCAEIRARSVAPHTRRRTRLGSQSAPRAAGTAWLRGWRGVKGGGGGGNRTRVPRCSVLGLYARSPSFGVASAAPTNRIVAGQLDCFSSRMGRAATSRPACCVSPRPPAGEGTSALVPSS